jgi:NADPH:quinone reductase-like Zn-dependent oxidoreductase
MRAFVQTGYGSADRLEPRELDRPEPVGDEVLVRVRATSINPYDWHHLRGEPLVARLMPAGPRLRGPRFPVLGCDVAGRVETVGPDVTGLRPGDDVFGLLDCGGFGEYVCVREGLLARTPGNVSAAAAAAVPMAAVTALLALRAAGLPGAERRRVLVNGASGGVGTFAVQIARAYGAAVTAVCGSRNAGLVTSLGADEVIDYRTSDFTRSGRRWDVVLDVAGGHPGRGFRRVLTRDGIVVLVGGPAGRWVQPAGHVFATLLGGALARGRVRLADAVAEPDKRGCLTELSALIEAGSVTPVIDRRYPFAELPAAVRYQETGRAPGKVVVLTDPAAGTA